MFCCYCLLISDLSNRLIVVTIIANAPCHSVAATCLNPADRELPAPVHGQLAN